MTSNRFSNELQMHVKYLEKCEQTMTGDQYETFITLLDDTGLSPEELVTGDWVDTVTRLAGIAVRV